MEIYRVQWKWKDEDKIYHYFHVVQSEFSFHKILFDEKRSKDSIVIEWEKIEYGALIVESPTLFYLNGIWDWFFSQFRLFGRFYHLTPTGRFYKKLDKIIDDWETET